MSYGGLWKIVQSMTLYLYTKEHIFTKCGKWNKVQAVSLTQCEADHATHVNVPFWLMVLPTVGEGNSGGRERQELWYWEWDEVFSPPTDWKAVRYFLWKVQIDVEANIDPHSLIIQSFML